MKLRYFDINYVFLSTRVAVGLVLFLIGFSELLNYSVVISKIRIEFAGTWVPESLLTIYLHILPFAELVLGLLLITGLFTRSALYWTGFLMLTINFGLLVKGDTTAAVKNIVYILLIGLDIIFINYNKYSLDRLLAVVRNKT